MLNALIFFLFLSCFHAPLGRKVSSQVTASEQSPERDFQPLSLLNYTLEGIVTPSKLATTADVEM